MEINQENYDKIIQIKDNDDAFEETLQLLEIFLEKYKEFKSNQNTENLDHDTFKEDTRIIFGLLYYVFSTVMDDENENDSDYKEDKEKFDVLVSHIRVINNSIEDIDLNNINNSFKESFSYIINYFDDTQKDQCSINNSLEGLDDNLQNFQKTLELTLKLNEIINKLDSIPKPTTEYLQESSKYTKEILKDMFSKEDVLIIINDIHSPTQPNYKELAENEENIVLKKKYCTYLQITNVITTQLSIEMMLKNY